MERLIRNLKHVSLSLSIMRPLKALLVTSPNSQLNAIRVNVVKRALGQTSVRLIAKCSTGSFNSHSYTTMSHSLRVARTDRREAPGKHRIGGRNRQYMARQHYGKENHDEITIRSA